MSSPPENNPIQASEPRPRLRLIPLEDTVVFPNMGITLTIDVGEDKRVVLVPRHENEFLDVGTIVEVSEQIRLPGGGRAVALSGEHRALIGAAQTGPGGELRVEVDERPDEHPVDGRTRELEREYRATVEEILELRGDDGRIAAFLRAIAEPGALADSAGYSPTISYEQKVELLRTLDVTERLELAIRLQRESLAELQVRKRIREDVQEGAEQQQREYFLRKQMESIRKELGDDEASVAQEYRAKIEDAHMPEPVEEQALKELGRLERMGEQTGESSMIRTYLDWLIAVPWGKRSEEHLDPTAARAVLDADHAGLEDVKDRVTEYLAVRKLRQERGIEADPKSGAILTLIGPPGTGKTSIGESIAHATGREFVRMSLGGVRDEAEIRGHRRTYIGALPGRLVRALRDAGTMNPVILLDEVDKVGADWRGDPSAALLEVLDPAQNHSFRDHYLDVELDLSQVMFLATANVADTIPGPLLDRMEVIRFDGYTSEEKLAIAKGYLWPRQRDRNGLREDEVEVSDDVLRTIIAEYTREAGVRSLERELGRVLRKTATKIASSQPSAEKTTPAGKEASATGGEAIAAEGTAEPSAEEASPAEGKSEPAKDEAKAAEGAEKSAKTAKRSKASKSKTAHAAPVKIDLEVVRDALGRQKFFQESAARTATPGVATGLAVTGAGGDVLFVEATAMKAGSGGNSLVLTGQLGDVMKESARIALSYVRGHAEDLGIDESAFENKEFHVHVPAGAIPKDGPSAGVTMVTALASLLSGRPVKHTVGMTGEVTLQGRVLPIGGFKQKALAANAAGLTDVILPERNRGDLDEIPKDVRDQMTFHPVMTVQEVLDRALEPARDVAHVS
ncbi:MAG: ATP-dependent protease La [Solirubrobacterales bacterium]|jgi:ATP-dependent Lon protease|nr:ATP-dependent protease La [Solirubrobacterales bacterium]